MATELITAQNKSIHPPPTCILVRLMEAQRDVLLILTVTFAKFHLVFAHKKKFNILSAPPTSFVSLFHQSVFGVTCVDDVAPIGMCQNKEDQPVLLPLMVRDWRWGHVAAINYWWSWWFYYEEVIHFRFRISMLVADFFHFYTNVAGPFRFAWKHPLLEWKWSSTYI